MRRTSRHASVASTSGSDDVDLCPVKKERSCTNLEPVTSKEIFEKLKKKRYIDYDEHFYLNFCFEDVELPTALTPADSEDVKNLALTLYYMSSEGYEYIRKHYKTPFPPSEYLGKLWMNNSFKPGFTSKAFEIIKQKSATKRLICALVVDDISLFGNSVRIDNYWIGLEDFGIGPLCEDDETFARDVYVFTLVSLEENWKIPIAYVMVKNTAYKRRAHLILTCLRESYYCGVDVVVLNFEFMNSFNYVAQHLGCNFKNPRDLKSTFKHPECDINISVFFNTWWLKVMVRNTLECNVLFRENSKVTWQPIKNLKQLQERSVKYNKQLTKAHLDFKNQMLKLDLTNLTFSYNIAKALTSYSEMIKGSDEGEARATTEYAMVFNKLCDVLASNAHTKMGHRKALCRENSKEVLSFLEEAREYILSLKLKKTPIVDTNKNQCYLAFLICIESVKQLYKTIVEKDQKLPHLATQKFSSDNTWALVENLLRQGNREPRAAEFKKIYEILVAPLRSTPIATSCIIAENLPMTKFARAVTNINYTSGRLAYNETYTNIREEAEVLKKHKQDKSLDTMRVYVKILNNDGITESFNEIIGSISGWVAKELLKVIKCEDCVDALFTNEEQWYHKMIPIRLNICGFCLPSDDVYKVCLKAEMLTRKFKRQVGHLMNNAVSIESLKVAVLERFVDSALFANIEEHSREQPPLYNHRLQVIRAVIDKYVDVRTENIKTSKTKKRDPFW